jgi:hypothetical protein
MSRFRNCRTFVALGAIAALLFAQLALAAYACPATGLAGSVSGNNVAGKSAPMPGCEGMDVEQPALCHAYAQAGSQSLDRPTPPDVPLFVDSSPVIAAAPLSPSPGPAYWRVERMLLARTTAPPIAIRNCCLRI